MSSIDRKQEQALARFYEEHIVPLGRANGMAFLDHSPDSSAESYLLARPRARMSHDDFVLKLSDARLAGPTLDARWDQTPLRGLGRRLLKLTRSFFPKVQEKGGLSAAIYEMF